MSDQLEIQDEPDREESRLADRLHAAKPVPKAGFRSRLGRHLAARDPGYGPRPPLLRAIAGACIGGGVLLLGVAALQATGAL